MRDDTTNTPRLYNSALGTFRVSPLPTLSSGVKRFDVVMIVEGQDRPLGTLYEHPDGRRSHRRAPSNLPDADELLRHLAGVIP